MICLSDTPRYFRFEGRCLRRRPDFRPFLNSLAKAAAFLPQFTSTLPTAAAGFNGSRRRLYDVVAPEVS